jgi:type I restriction enzyme M protein
VEAFLPQVGVQASLLFLQKRSDAEVSALTESDYPIFMAIAEQVGHDRRGLTVYRRDPDGFEVYKEQRVDLEVLHNGERRVESRMIKVREEADDLPVIAKAYREWVKRVEMPTVA